jgi:hypothetical protein
MTLAKRHAKRLAINGDRGRLPGVSARIFAFKSDSFLYYSHLVTSERDNTLVTADQMRQLIQQCWSSVFPEKSESVLISLHPVTYERNTALVAADHMRQIIQKCWSLVFTEKSESLLISLCLVTSERDNGFAAADQIPQQSRWSLMFPESLLFD